MKIFTLKQLCDSLSRCVENHYSQSYYIEAEMNKLNFYSYSGHAYPDLVYKEHNFIVAEMRAVIWRDNYKRINQIFLDKIGEPLKEGIKILCLGKLNFDAKHGISLQIQDILPEYTLGDLALEKKKTIELLQQKGVFSLNKKLPLASLPKNLAIISVESSKGYQDFTSILQEKASRFGIQHQLFPALLQGDEAIISIIESFEKIEASKKHFDCVIIIRGGGGDVGLACYNHIVLAEKVACFPIPVLAGIGHKSNETVVEMVAHQSGITPSAIAHFIVEKFIATEQILLQEEQKLKLKTKDLIKECIYSLQFLEKSIVALSKTLIQNKLYLLDTEKRKLTYGSKALLIQKNAELEKFRLSITLSNPELVLKKGFALVYKDKKIITDADLLKIGQTVQIKLHKKNIEAEIKNISHE